MLYITYTMYEKPLSCSSKQQKKKERKIPEYKIFGLMVE